MKTSPTLRTGVRLEYAEYGEADGTPIVFLHGLTDSWRSFERVLPLLPSSVHAFAVSQRGHGESTRPQSGYLLSNIPTISTRSSTLSASSGRWWSGTRWVPVWPSGSPSITRRASPRWSSSARLPACTATGAHGFYTSVIAGLTDPIDRLFVRSWQLGTLARTCPPTTSRSSSRRR